MIKYHKKTDYRGFYQEKHNCPACRCRQQPKVKNIISVYDYSDGKIKQWSVPDILLNKIIDQTTKKENFITKFFNWAFNSIRKLFKREAKEKIVRFYYKNGNFKKVK